MPPKADVLGPGTFTVGSAGTLLDLTAQVTNLIIDWSEDVDDDLPVLSGEVVPGDATYTPSVKGTLLQDLSASGMYDFSWGNKGQILPFSFVPSTAKGREVTGTCRIAPLSLGGDVKKKNTSDFEWAAFDVELGDVV